MSMPPFDEPKQAVKLVCPSCGAASPVLASDCWRCRGVLEGGRRDVLYGPSTYEKVRKDRSFGLSTLMLVMALVAVCLGIMKVAPLTSIGLTVASLFAFARTVQIVRARLAESGSVSAPDKVRIFATSLMITVLAVAALAGTFLAVCSVLFAIGAGFDLALGSENGFGVAIGMASGFALGALAARWVAGWIQANFWSPGT